MSNWKQKQQASVFDIIGPRMVGPSSSHTAGALRISLLGRRLAGESLKSVHFILYGSFARTYQGHGTDRALVAGALGLETDDLRVRDSFMLAYEQGLEFSFEPDVDTIPAHPNTVAMEMVTESGRVYRLEGQSIGGGQAVISRIDDVDVELSGAYDTMVVEHWDRPGALMRMTQYLTEQHVNIAALKLYRESRGGKAFAIIEADEHIPRTAAEAIAEDEGVIRTIRIHRLED